MERTITGSEREGRRHGARHPILLAVLVLVFVGLPAVASAGPRETTSGSGIDVWCESESGFLGLNVFQEEDSSFLNVYFEPFEEPFVVFGSTEEFGFDGSSLTAEVEMYAESFENGEEPVPVGTAEVAAGPEPLGEPDEFSDRFRDGNRWIEVHQVIQEMATTGSATLADYFDFDLSECGGAMFEFSATWTNPNAYNGSFEGRFAECALESPEGDFGHLFTDSSEYGSFMEIFIQPTEGPMLFGFADEVTFTDTELSALATMFEEMSEEPVGEAAVAASLESFGSFTNTIIRQDAWYKVTIEQFDVAGTVTVDGLELAMVDCIAEEYAERIHESNANGPKPTGKAPNNDAPDGAESLDIGSTLNAQTKAAATDPEADCVIIVDEGGNGENGENGEPGEEIPIPFGKTLWYSFVGTGGPVTVDTHGSNFDTVIGIYDVDHNQIACVDDVSEGPAYSSQAAATIDTEEGHTYLVQIGGIAFYFDGPEEEGLPEYGRLRLEVR